MADIRGELQKIQEARRKKMKEAMGEYDKAVYYPAMTDLRERCEAAGHVKSSAGRHYNGLGWSWHYCGRCQSRLDIQQS